MKATTTLQVSDDMTLQVTLQLSVGEARGLVKLLDDARAWPSGVLRSVLHQSLQKATQAYQSDHAIQP